MRYLNVKIKKSNLKKLIELKNKYIKMEDLKMILSG